MKLNLTKPLIVFDLETTGLDLVNDRIIQIAYIKVELDGSSKSVNYIINPQKRIPELVEQLTSITNEMVADKPTFKELSTKLAAEFSDCDFAGYNSNRFDIPLLAEEFLRAGIDFDFASARMLDASIIFRKMERRNLASAYKFYTGRKMEDDFQAHLADQDTAATWAVLQAQLDYYSAERQEEEERRLENDMDVLNAFCNDTQSVDYAGNIVWADVTDAAGVVQRKEVFNFGKYKGQPVAEVLRRDPGYFSWVLGADFTLYTKQVLTRIRLRESKR